MLTCIYFCILLHLTYLNLELFVGNMFVTGFPFKKKKIHTDILSYFVNKGHLHLQ